MAKDWTCPRCSTKNDDAAYNCSNCRLIRGSVVVPPATMAAPPLADAAPDAAPAGDAPTDAAQPSAWVAAESSAPAAPKPFWRRIPLSWLFWGVLILGGSIAGAVFNAARDDGGDITKAGDMKISDLRVGDCFDIKDPAAETIEDVKAVPCTQEHEYEMFLIRSMASGSYPSDAAFSTFVENECLPAFGTYVGLSYDESELDVFYVVPSADSWGDGDRAVQCSIYHPRIHRLTGSQKGSAR
ncbi:MAG TPA: septum formation family protein [Candidatus Polarisedimenticolia bacterium]|nr:septum formation family protein [Candidatus Polarisedimenticolia bacterium]